jgi:transposase
MPAARMNMRMIKQVLRLKFAGGLSLERTAASLDISKGAVAKYVSLAQAAGLDWAMIQDMDEVELEARLRPSSVGPWVERDFASMHRELGRKGLTLMLLWQEYQASYPGQRTYRYSQYCERYRQWAKRLKRSMRQVHRAGEKLFVDFAGPTLALTDGSRAHVFVAALGASSYTFACATAGQKTEHWVDAMTRALTFIGGVPQMIVPDNPRAVIAQADRYEPRAVDSVLDFARHYATSVLPARPHTPQDKARVESAVQVVERWILARLRHCDLDTVAQADRAIAALLGNLNDRPFQKLPGSRTSAFQELDAPALAPLPTTPYEIAAFKTVRVNVDYHVEIARHRYSVPHALVGQALDARITAHAVELLHRGRRVAVHARSQQAAGYTTLEAHMPAAHRAHLQWTPQRLIDWGLAVGPGTGDFVKELLSRYKHPEHGYRACLGLLSLDRRYGRERLEAACTLALTLGAYQYRHVRDILAAGRDRVPIEPAASWTSPTHEYLRGPAYYQ